LLVRCPERLSAGIGRPIERRHASVFGCDVELVSLGAPVTAFGDVIGSLRELDGQFSRFQPDSELSRFNRAAGIWCDTSPRMSDLLRRGMDAAERSSGLVNIAVLPCLNSAGYDRSWPFVSHRPRAAADAGEAHVDAPVPPLPDVVQMRPGQARLRRGSAIDVAALAKGVWADEFVDYLGGNAVCNLGGDLACRGDGPDGSGWPVVVTGGSTYYLRNAGAATSGTRKRRWGADRHHLIDPRTGHPSASDICTASVLSPACATADWVATAVVIGGGAHADALARRLGSVQIEWEKVNDADDRRGDGPQRPAG
jgi:FAD:protein FMN transferase